MGMIGDLFARIGLRLDSKSFSRADAALASAKSKVDKLDGAWKDTTGRWRARTGKFLGDNEKLKLGLEDAGKKAKQAAGMFDGMGSSLIAMAAGTFGLSIAGKAMIGFNADVQDTKLQIAGMLALTKKTDLVDQIAVADNLFASLQKRAATLPGTTAEYAKMAGMLTQPITDAGLGLKDLEDLTVNSVVAAKAFGIQWEVAARDIDQMLRGQFHSVDQFTGKLMGSMGFKGEEGRKKINQGMSQKQRGELLKQALQQKQITQLAAAQGQTFRGILSTLQDSAEQFFGKVGIRLFSGLTDAIRKANTWLDAHQEKIAKIADTIGGALADAFTKLGEAIGFLMSDSDEAHAVLVAILAVVTAIAGKMVLAWVRALGPIAALGLAVFAAYEVFEKLRDVIGDTGAAIAAAFTGIAILSTIAKVRELTGAMGALKSAMPAGLGGGGGMLGALGPIGLGLGLAEGANQLTGGSLDMQRILNSGGDLNKVMGAPLTQIKVDMGGINIQAPPETDPQKHAELVRPHFRAMFESEMRKAVS